MFSHEIKKKTFSKTIMGYNPAEVDEYVSYVLSKYSEACREYEELERKFNAALEMLEQAKSEANMISATIVNAHKMADAIVGDAKAKAEEIRSTVDETCNSIIAAYVEKVAVERDKLAKVEKTAMEFKSSLYEAYKEHIAMIDNIMPDEEPTPYLSDEELENKAVELSKEQIHVDNGNASKSDEETSDDETEE